MATIFRYVEGQNTRGGLATARAVRNIRKAIREGQITFVERTMKEGERLDIIASNSYGDARLWWIIAAASNIGWWMQIPAGTRIRIPPNLGQIDQVVV